MDNDVRIQRRHRGWGNSDCDGWCRQLDGLWGQLLNMLLQRHICNWWSDVDIAIVFIGLSTVYVAEP